jgi:putative ABC transport system permease protein
VIADSYAEPHGGRLVVSLGLGIGANTTVFTWVQAILLNPFPGVHNPDSLLIANLQSRDGRPRSWSYPNYRDMRDRSRLAEMVGQDDLTISIAVAGQSERGFGGLVSGNYFQTMGLTPAVGRLIGPEERPLSRRSSGCRPQSCVLATPIRW